LSRRLRRYSCSSRSSIAVDEILKFFAGLEERNALWGDFYLGACLRIATHPATTLAGAEAAKTTNLDFVTRLQCLDDGIENGLHNCLGFLAGQLGGSYDLFDQIGFGHGRVIHRSQFSPIQNSGPFSYNVTRFRF
jgi:hypothetical protein